MPFSSSTWAMAGIVTLIDGGHRGLFRAVAHHVAVGFFAQQQRQGVDQDGFARAGLAGQQVQSSSKLNHHIVDDGVVFNAQFPEHVGTRSVGVFPARIPRPGHPRAMQKSCPAGAAPSIRHHGRRQPRAPGGLHLQNVTGKAPRLGQRPACARKISSCVLICSIWSSSLQTVPPKAR